MVKARGGRVLGDVPLPKRGREVVEEDLRGKV